MVGALRATRKGLKWDTYEFKIQNICKYSFEMVIIRIRIGKRKKKNFSLLFSFKWRKTGKM